MIRGGWAESIEACARSTMTCLVPSFGGLVRLSFPPPTTDPSLR